MIISLLLISSITILVVNENSDCKKIDYSDKELWTNCMDDGICPIRNVDGSFIEYPIGCEK